MTGESTGAQKFGYGALGVVNSILNVAGNLAAIYNLGRTEVKNTAGDVKLFKSEPSAKYTFKKDADGNWAIF